MKDKIEIVVGDVWTHTSISNMTETVAKVSENHVWLEDTNDECRMSRRGFEQNWKRVQEAKCWMCKPLDRKDCSLCYGTGVLSGTKYDDAKKEFENELYEKLKPIIDNWTTEENMNDSIMSQEPTDDVTSFQTRAAHWASTCFPADYVIDNQERNDRFLEESLELVQACGGNAKDAHTLVDYVFNREVGEKTQELGGVMVTLAVLSSVHNMDMNTAAENELVRNWFNIEKIRKKQANAPKDSPITEQRCGQCHHFAHCTFLIQAKEDWTECDWKPSKFVLSKAERDIKQMVPTPVYNDTFEQNNTTGHLAFIEDSGIYDEEEPSLDDHLERAIVQLAGVATAAMGATNDPAHQGDYGWSPAYQEVLDLRLKYDALKNKIKEISDM